MFVAHQDRSALRRYRELGRETAHIPDGISRASGPCTVEKRTNIGVFSRGRLEIRLWSTRPHRLHRPGNSHLRRRTAGMHTRRNALVIKMVIFLTHD